LADVPKSARRWPRRRRDRPPGSGTARGATNVKSGGDGGVVVPRHLTIAEQPAFSITRDEFLGIPLKL